MKGTIAMNNHPPAARAAHGPVLVLASSSNNDAVLRFAATEAAIRDVPVEILAPSQLLPSLQGALSPADLTVGSDRYQSAGDSPLPTNSLPEGCPPIPVSTSQLIGATADDLRDRAPSASMLVLNSSDIALDSRSDAHGLGQLADLNCPIAVVPDTNDGTRRRNQIAVGVDDTPASCRAAEYAARESTLRGASLLVFHADKYANLIEIVTGGRTGPLTAISERQHSIAARQAAALHNKYPRLTITSTDSNHTAANEVLRIALRFDAIILGRWKHSLLPDGVDATPMSRLAHAVQCPLISVN
ncbi:universal stress protein [Tsukamurella tyrosinosolvens]|uniref:universal stress protein n=1 Tax=Tsukamurella tyrosinosolvens TaxID=57704 RepID=UPI000D1C7AD1|nr:universal stress protein [Tsukamurella tyrosinosolvens]